MTKRKTADYVSEYLEKHMPIKEKDLTLLKLANRIIKTYGLTVKPKTVMSAIAKELINKYDTTWNRIELNNRYEFGIDFSLYIMGNIVLKDDKPFYYITLHVAKDNVESQINQHYKANPSSTLLINYRYSRKHIRYDKDYFKFFVTWELPYVLSCEKIEDGYFKQAYELKSEVYKTLESDKNLLSEILENTFAYYVEDEEPRTAELDWEEKIPLLKEFWRTNEHLLNLKRLHHQITGERDCGNSNDIINYQLKRLLKSYVCIDYMTQDKADELYKRYAEAS